MGLFWYFKAQVFGYTTIMLITTAVRWSVIASFSLVSVINLVITQTLYVSLLTEQIGDYLESIVSGQKMSSCKPFYTKKAVKKAFNYLKSSN